MMTTNTDTDIGRSPVLPVALLNASGITVRFGGLTALRDVRIEMGTGSIVGLLGPNGAGKSTLLGVLSGVISAQTGRVTIDGRDVSRLPAQKRVVLGLARTFQHPELFAELTVREHLSLAYRLSVNSARVWTDPLTGRYLLSDPTEQAEVAVLLDLLGIRDVADRPVGGLPLGVSRLVEIGRALATAPKIVLLDEPSSGLNPEESRVLAVAPAKVVAFARDLDAPRRTRRRDGLRPVRAGLRPRLRRADR
jgi:ABC-type branched-subunit amino acid transport system ATPase component